MILSLFMFDNYPLYHYGDILDSGALEYGTVALFKTAV